MIIKEKRTGHRKRKSSTEKKAKMRIKRKDPAERRKQAIKNVCKTVVEKPIEHVCSVTIPISEETHWNRNKAAM